MKAPPSENKLQATLISELGFKMRQELIVAAIPNGGLRSARVAMQLKSAGVLPGMPDLVFALEQAATLWLELKAANGRLSDKQLGLHAKLRRLGHIVETVSSVEEALDVLNKRGLLR